MESASFYFSLLADRALTGSNIPNDIVKSLGFLREEKIFQGGIRTPPEVLIVPFVRKVLFEQNTV